MVRALTTDSEAVMTHNGDVLNNYYKAVHSIRNFIFKTIDLPDQ